MLLFPAQELIICAITIPAIAEKPATERRDTSNAVKTSVEALT